MAETKPLGLRRLLGPLAPRPRLSIGILVGLVVGVGLTWVAPQMQAFTQLILGWDALSGTFLGLMFFNMVRHTPTDIRAQAAIDDEGRGVILALVLAAAAASVWAISLELSLAKEAHGALKAAHIVLGFLTVVVSWLMVQMIFALHYAHEFYGVDEDDGARDAGGIEFPGHEDPDYWDFFYFSVVIGVACATADANIASKGLRRLSTVHCLIAFAFNTIIVALTINLTAGLF
ncbi:DUF1345 domain-containing protein [Phenylobacterium sp.]|jgi:uncharacterized membrane protein|uniref:DUF1345 domain-containing protein n=1 Tax=Phenylobacterium sp. TaxID=1871053 RepID=UPI002F425D6D